MEEYRPTKAIVAGSNPVDGSLESEWEYYPHKC